MQVGDTVSCQLAGDDERFTLAVNQIVENNLSQGVYLTRTTWESLRKGAFTPTALYLLNPSQTCLSILQDSPEVDEIDTTGKPGPGGPDFPEHHLGDFRDSYSDCPADGFRDLL